MNTCFWQHVNQLAEYKITRFDFAVIESQAKVGTVCRKRYITWLPC